MKIPYAVLHRNDTAVGMRLYDRDNGTEGDDFSLTTTYFVKMAKLYFRYGTMGSSKTLNLLAVAHNYRQQGKTVFLLKPHLDTRFGTDTIRSRSGLESPADVLLNEDSILDYQSLGGAHCLLVDEAQFLSASVIDQLRYFSVTYNIPVICYGLRTDFRGKLFPGSKRLFELADSIEEVKTTCHFCNRKATMNLRVLDGQAVFEGAVVQLGSEDKYLPSCFPCYQERRTQALSSK